MWHAVYVVKHDNQRTHNLKHANDCNPFCVSRFVAILCGCTSPHVRGVFKMGILVSVVRWNLPPLKQDDDNAGNDAQRRVLSLAAVAAAAAAAGPHSGAVGAAAAVLDVPPPPAAEQWVVAPCLEATAGGSCLFKAASSSGPRTSWVQLSALPSGCSGSYMAAVAEVQGVE